MYMWSIVMCFCSYSPYELSFPSAKTSLSCPGATKDMGKMLGGEEEKDPDAAKKEEERQEALRQQEEERKAKHARMEAEREKVRQTIRDKVGNLTNDAHTPKGCMPFPPHKLCKLTLTQLITPEVQQHFQYKERLYCQTNRFTLRPSLGSWKRFPPLLPRHQTFGNLDSSLCFHQF